MQSLKAIHAAGPEAPNAGGKTTVRTQAAEPGAAAKAKGAKRYEKGRSCVQLGRAHAYGHVEGTHYSRCDRCGSTRTDGAKATPKARKGKASKQGKWD